MSWVDWDSAPEGATHARQYGLAGVDFYKRDCGQWLYWLNGGWNVAFSTNESHCIARPSSQEWNGEGLPPIGIVCERNVSRSNWCPSKVFAHSPCGRFAAFLDSCGMNWACAESFRPIRTQAQIEEDEREAARSDMVEVTQGARNWMEAFGKIYDAGYRKQPTKQDGE